MNKPKIIRRWKNCREKMMKRQRKKVDIVKEILCTDCQLLPQIGIMSIQEIFREWYHKCSYCNVQGDISDKNKLLTCRLWEFSLHKEWYERNTKFKNANRHHWMCQKCDDIINWFEKTFRSLLEIGKFLDD